MATQRVSRLQKQMLRWLLTDHQRTRGVLASSHEELVQALGSDKGNISHSLRTLAYSGRRFPLIPVETCQRFRSKVATDSD
jgi:hypothetical protein